MAKTCAITGKHSTVGRKYSNRVRATQFNPVSFQRAGGQTTKKVRRKANLQKKTYFVPEVGKKVTLTVSTKGIRTINKLGVFQALRKAGIITAK
jgi:large subunit ribosomal protein L28